MSTRARCKHCGTFSGILPGAFCSHDEEHAEYLEERKRWSMLLDESSARVGGTNGVRNVIEKLTAPPETVREHLERIGVHYFVQHDIVRGRNLLVVDMAKLAEAEGNEYK